MIESRRIQKTLDLISQEYDRTMNIGKSDLPVLYSKMAILELCGWIEWAFDEIAINSIRQQIPKKSDRQIVDKKIKGTSGFTYDATRELLLDCVGAPRLLKIEKKLNRRGELDQLKNYLGTLNKLRKDAAHTTHYRRNQTYFAPSWAINQFQTILPILKKLWLLVKEY